MSKATPQEETHLLLHAFEAEVKAEQARLLQLGIELSFQSKPGKPIYRLDPERFRELVLNFLRDQTPQIYRLLSSPHGVLTPLGLQMMLLSDLDQLDPAGEEYLKQLDGALTKLACDRHDLKPWGKRLKSLKADIEVLSYIGEVAVAAALLSLLPKSRVVPEPETNGGKHADLKVTTLDGRSLYAEVKCFRDDFYDSAAQIDSRSRPYLWRVKELRSKLDGNGKGGVPEQLPPDTANLLFVMDVQSGYEGNVATRSGKSCNLELALCDQQGGLFVAKSTQERWSRVGAGYRFAFWNRALVADRYDNPNAPEILHLFPELSNLGAPPQDYLEFFAM